MSIHAKCPACGAEFKRPDGLAGKNEKCPECRFVFRLPTGKGAPKAEVRHPQPKTAQPSRTTPQQQPVARQQPASRQQPAAPQQPAQSVKPQTTPAETFLPPVHPKPVENSPILETPATFEEIELAREELTSPMVAPEVETQMPPESVLFESEPEPSESASRDEEVELPLEDVDLPPLENPMHFVAPEAEEGFEEAAISPPSPSTPFKKNVDYVALAAKEISAKRPLNEVEDAIIEQGMDEIDAQQLVESLAKIAFHRKKSKGLIGAWIVIGLAFTALFAYGAHWVTANEGPPAVMYISLGLAVFFLLIFLLNLLRLVLRSRPMKAEKLIAKWHHQYR
jgi:hypothetical protein